MISRRDAGADKLLAVDAVQHALDTNGASALPALKGLGLGEPHEAAAGGAWDKLIRTDGSDTHGFSFVTGAQSWP
jgi:hypothetical protein